MRLFGQHESQCRIVFYRDHALWCPYCHKVQLLLELKAIPYKVKKVNMSCYGKKNKEFLAKVPSGLLPVIELDGEIVTESMDIMFLIEEQFSAPKFSKTIPSDNADMMQAFHKFMRLERLYIGAWLGCLRGNMVSIVSDKNLKAIYHVLDLIEGALTEFEGPYFYPGELPSFVDINFSSILERSRASLKYWRNLDITADRPAIKNWFVKWEQWAPASYLRSDDWTHIGALPPQIGPVRFLSTRSQDSLFVEQSRNLHILNDGPEKQIERNIAASNLCRNADIVVPDAIRGCKSDNKEHHEYVDLALRILAQVLYEPDLLEVLEDRLRSQIPQEAWKVVGDGLRFEKIRVCAPRDMPITSMKEFCGGINWILKTLEQDL